MSSVQTETGVKKKSLFKRQSELVIYDERERGKEGGVSKQIFKYFGGLKVGKFRGQKPPFFNTTLRTVEIGMGIVYT